MSSSQNAIECKSVGKQYPHFRLNDIDLTVPTGSVMGFVGPNGAGKSTTLRIIMGLVHQDNGEVRVLGRPMPKEQIDAKWDVGYISEDMRLYPTQTIAFHLRFMKSVFPSWDDDYATTLLGRFGLIPEQKIKGLSHGQRVKANLLMALARRPKLLVLDEPTTGLDPVARRQVLEEIGAVLADESRTVLFSSHNTLDVEQISDQITFINNGSIIFTKDKETLLDSWRRLRLRIPDGFAMPEVPGLVDARQNGHLAVVTTSQYTAGIETAFTRMGASITDVERLTLEEIFLTCVPAQQEAAA